jgi:hypothetical protein
MKQIIQIALAIMFLIPSITWAQNSYSMAHDANGSRTNRIMMRKMNNPVAGADSTILAIADSALLQAINAQKELQANPTEIATAQQSIINVYPNPTSDRVVVSYSATCPKCVLRIFNIEAKQVYETKGIDKITEIDVSNLKSGTYYLSITTEDGKRQGWKIVKQ